MKNICILLIAVIAFASNNPLNAQSPDASFVSATITTDSNSTLADSKDSAACSVPLPLAGIITDFAGVRSSKNVILSWVTQEESNSNTFIIEKSNSANSWKNLATVNAAGTRTTPNVYNYGDLHAVANSYYRLKETSKDGPAVYSSVVKVTGR